MSDWHTANNKGRYDFTKAVTTSFRSYSEAHSDVVSDALERPNVSPIDTISWWLLVVEDEVPGFRISGRSRRFRDRFDSAAAFWKGASDKWEPQRQNRDLIYRLLYWLYVDEGRSSFAREAERELFANSGSFEAEFGVPVPKTQAQADKLISVLVERRNIPTAKVSNGTDLINEVEIVSAPIPSDASVQPSLKDLAGQSEHRVAWHARRTTRPVDEPLAARLSSWIRLRKRSYVALGALTFGSIFLTAGWLYQYDNNYAPVILEEPVEQPTREDIERAWSELSKRAGGNTGKGRAIATLLIAKENLIGVNLSCRNVGMFSNGICEIPPIFDFENIGRALRKPIYHGSMTGESPSFARYEPDAELNTMVFDESIIRNMSDMILVDASFRNAVGVDWYLDGKDTLDYEDYGAFEGFKCKDCYFSNMYIDWRVVANAEDTSLSNNVVIFPSDTRVEVNNGSVSLVSEKTGMNISLNDTGFYWNNRLGYLPLFLRPLTPDFSSVGKQQVEQFRWLDEIYGDPRQITPLTTPANQAIFWELYDQRNYCMSLHEILDYGIEKEGEIYWTKDRNGIEVSLSAYPDDEFFLSNGYTRESQHGRPSSLSHVGFDDDMDVSSKEQQDRSVEYYTVISDSSSAKKYTEFFKKTGREAFLFDNKVCGIVAKENDNIREWLSFALAERYGDWVFYGAQPEGSFDTMYYSYDCADDYDWMTLPRTLSPPEECHWRRPPGPGTEDGSRVSFPVKYSE